MTAEMHLERYQEIVDRRLDQLLPPITQTPCELHEAMRYSCLAPGKRLRPALCIAAAEAVGTKPVVDAACALEMVHCFSLIHDDLPAIDDDELRRGRETCHVKFGEALAILAGDALFALAYQALIGAWQGFRDISGDLKGVDADRYLRSVQVLAKAVGSDGLVGGEVMDVLSEGREVRAETLEFIHSRKTGALIAASCEIGGLLGGASAEEAETLRRFGTHVGLAFQIADDLLNELSTPEELGKAAGSDRLKGKATYPALYGVEAAAEAARSEVELALRHLEGFDKRAGALRDLAWYAVERLK